MGRAKTLKPSEDSTLENELGVIIRFSSWEWRLIRSIDVATAKRDIDMLIEWLKDVPLINIARKNNMTSANVRARCFRAMRGIRKAGLVTDQEDKVDGWKSIYLAAIVVAEQKQFDHEMNA